MQDVVSLDLAKRLRDAGWPQKEECGDCETKDLIDGKVGKCRCECHDLATPTIGQLLQAFYDHEQNVRLQSFWDAEWTVEYMSDTKWVDPEPGVIGPPADMLARCWLSLKEKGII